MRKIHTVIVTNIENGERVKAIDIISKALAKDFGKECIVVQEGHMSDCALDSIPSSISVFVVASDQPKLADPLSCPDSLLQPASVSIPSSQ